MAGDGRDDIKLKKCGVRFEPPAIMVTYVNSSGKLHRRTMPLRNFNKRSGVPRVAEELKNSSRHKKYLEHLPLPQLEKLICIIRDKMNGVSLESSLRKNSKLTDLDPDEDLNKVDEETLKRKKAIMEEAFNKNKKEIGDEDFVYDVEVDFEGAAGGAATVETCEWDSNSDNEF